MRTLWPPGILGAALACLILLASSCAIGTPAATGAAVCAGEHPSVASSPPPPASPSGPDDMTLYMGSHGFGVAVPRLWVKQATTGDEEGYTNVDETQQLSIGNFELASDVSGSVWTNAWVTHFNTRFNTQPESSEPTTIGGAAATLRVYHFTYQEQYWYALLIVCARPGVGTVFQWLSTAGTEPIDRLLFDKIRASFFETGTFG